VILVTGGAGFIGQHLCRRLCADGGKVRIIDSFTSQVHGERGEIAPDLVNAVELLRADVREKRVLTEALRGVNTVVHLAAETGTGQSMYEVERYFAVNVLGTAVLLDALQGLGAQSRVERIVLASSRAVYGEGAYRCAEHGIVYPEGRAIDRLEGGDFEPLCPKCALPVACAPTPESAPLHPTSVYGLTKQVQEQAIFLYARTSGISAVALRYQNVFGPGQSLKNPYTGILAVFSTLARAGRPIEVYEDGQESRDFVYIDDVIDATVKAVRLAAPFVGPLNVGSGVPTSVLAVARAVNGFFGGRSDIRVSGAYRLGDVRHNQACSKQARKVLGFSAVVDFLAGLRTFLEWARVEGGGDADGYDRSVSELVSKGLMGKAKSRR